MLGAHEIDIVRAAAAAWVSAELARLGHQRVAPRLIVERVRARAHLFAAFPAAAERRALATEAAIAGCWLARPRNPAEAAHELGLRSALVWGWGAGERLMDALDEAIEVGLARAGLPPHRAPLPPRRREPARSEVQPT